MTFDEALKFFKTQSNMAKKLGVSPQVVQHWRVWRRIPIGRQYQIELLTGGELKANC